MQTTTELEKINFTAPERFDELRRAGPSSVGQSAVSSWLSCPEQSHLSALGVRPKPYGNDGVMPDQLAPTDFGTLMHALRAHRITHGQQSAEAVLYRYWDTTREVGKEDAEKALLMLRLYDQNFPLANETFEILGVECLVVSDIRSFDGTQPLIRTVRYDTVIRADGGIFSFECKTSSRNGGLDGYKVQGMTHSALWNANPALVAKYGEMQGSIWDLLIKTKVPKCERVGPHYFSKVQQNKALMYLRMPEAITMPVLPDGSYPRFLHTCWGRYSCKYINGCHEDAWGDYEIVDKETGDTRPYWPGGAP